MLKHKLKPRSGEVRTGLGMVPSAQAPTEYIKCGIVKFKMTCSEIADKCESNSKRLSIFIYKDIAFQRMLASSSKEEGLV